MTGKSDEPAYSMPVIDMLKVANEYCIFIERIENFPPDELFSFIQKLFPLMYLKGSLLPEIFVEIPEANERFITAEQWENTFGILRERFAESDEFWILDLEGPDETNPIKASISELLTDIYQDMKDFVLLYQKEGRAAKQNAANECKSLFFSHWGIRIIDILKVIHSRKSSGLSKNEFDDFL
jgi:hypothetical protein